MMRFQIAATINYKAKAPSTLLLNVQPYKSAGQVIINENFHSNPELNTQELDARGGEKRFKVIAIPNAGDIELRYTAMVENNLKILPAEQLNDVPISLMPANALFYLNPSRYCQSDKLYRFAYNKFGKIDQPFQKVMAIRDWIFHNVAYSSGYTTPQTSAFDTITEQMGVCRDFAHLGIALCRALTIPARYFTCYAYKLNPQDFHACFEVYLGGHWIIIDATKLVPVNGLIKIATGADATDTALASIFGNLQFKNMQIETTLLNDETEKIDHNSLSQGYSYY
jgi:transglutaminase-like putative cysteine protease